MLPGLGSVGEALAKGAGTLKVKGFSRAPDGGGDGVSCQCAPLHGLHPSATDLFLHVVARGGERLSRANILQGRPLQCCLLNRRELTLKSECTSSRAASQVPPRPGAKR